MEVHYDYKNYKVRYPIITIGAFDGVHLGHREILKKLCNTSVEKKGESVVVTLWPHPRIVLEQDHTIRLLSTLEEKLKLLEDAGIQHTVIIPFTKEFSDLTSLQFVEDILVKKLNVSHLIVGYNHHFGKNREGNFDMIAESGVKYGFTAEKLNAKYVEQEKVSSTLIRKALQSGNVTDANRYLGYEYALTGTVMTGDKIGRTIGFPTANLKISFEHKLIPGNGVYAVTVDIDGLQFKGMMNIGFRPTINSNTRLSLEVNLFDFSDNLYDKEVTVRFRHRIRDEMKFENLEQLKKQIEADKAAVSKILEA